MWGSRMAKSSSAQSKIPENASKCAVCGIGVRDASSPERDGIYMVGTIKLHSKAPACPKCVSFFSFGFRGW